MNLRFACSTLLLGVPDCVASSSQRETVARRRPFIARMDAW